MNGTRPPPASPDHTPPSSRAQHLRPRAPWPAPREARTPEPSAANQEPTILVVCTGNICRSPAAERLLARGLGPGIRVTSAGVRAVKGAPISSPMARLLDEAGAPSGDFAATQLNASAIAGATLILTMTREHRATVVELLPAAVRRTFTLREFATFAAMVDPAALPEGPPTERLTALIPLAAGRRGMIPTDPHMDDVADPYGGGDRLYALSFGQLRPAVDTIVRILHGSQ